MRVAAALVVALGVALAFAQAQTTPAPRFEVASLKPSPPGGRFGGVRPAPGGERYVATNATLTLLLMVAYRVKPDQITGGPAWIATDTYDMNAKAAGPSTVEDLHLMLQDLIAERFKLKFHYENKDLPMYALTVDSSGPKMKRHDAENSGEPWIDQSVTQVVQVKMSAKFSPMDYFAWRLGQSLDRPVVDQTGLKGGYDFDLNFTRDLPQGIPEGALINGAPVDTSGPTVFEALKRQLGLKLTAQKGPVPVIVIDHVEKPAVE
ncbi:MAG TPA: TIGR03435 family protein [Bryobacteraceae bacterium]|nr:TIGR03435 family protein [Bryobacteraceae bacterium]